MSIVASAPRQESCDLHETTLQESPASPGILAGRFTLLFWVGGALLMAGLLAADLLVSLGRQ